MTCPVPATVMPSVGEGETFASGVQVPCAYAACPAVKVPSAPATIARNHFLRVQKRSNIFLSSLEVIGLAKKRHCDLLKGGNTMECERVYGRRETGLQSC